MKPLIGQRGVPERAKSRSANRHVLRDSGLYFGAQLGARALNFVYFILLARTLPTDEFGLLNYVLTVIVTLDIIVDLGLSRHAMREISKYPDQAADFLSRLLPFKMAAAAAVYVVYCIWVLSLHQPMTYTLIAFFSATGLFSTAPAMLLENVVQAHHRFALISGANVALAVVQFLLGGGILLLGGSTVAISLGFAVTYFVYASIMASEVLRLGIKFRPAIAPIAVLRSLPSSLPYLVSAIIILLAIRAEFLVLGYFGTPVELGLFGMAVKVVEAGMLLPLALGAVMSPRFAKGHAQVRDQLQRLYFSGFQVLLLLALAAVLAALVMVPLVPLVLNEPEFDGIDHILRILFIGYPAACIYIFNTAFLFGAARQRRPLALMLLLAALQIIINVMLQSQYGMIGAAMSFTLFMGLAAVISTLFILILYTGVSGFYQSLATPVASAVIAFGAYMILNQAPETWRLIGALAAFSLSAIAIRVSFPKLTGHIDLSI
ncbi:oligosaccharide flippase family protein [Aquicoccus sp. G2-2]|uniref:oligosaccharide flippase family protein n=1 Tax=Aquicoccus sp. G2-2 TaxID=3092120 RepID=UPI002AE01B0D|nr:oligosaccharide flippase family protein [Aquicoccus sp. G2-2]MEA1114612.1 oligosaccharide flippase family protein [Aquicoccus sp. G2-2]